MKTILYMGITPNGYIAKSNGDSDWTSEEDLQGFFENSKRIGNVIMGKNTFLVVNKYGYFPFPEALNIVLTHEQLENSWGEKVEFSEASPKEVLELLGQRGFKEALVIGGGQVNVSFMKEGLIDEIYLDVEPLIFGQGIKLLAEADFEAELELLEVKKLNANTVQLHYLVKK